MDTDFDIGEPERRWVVTPTEQPLIEPEQPSPERVPERVPEKEPA